jgi:hypothetical protein
MNVEIIAVMYSSNISLASLRVVAIKIMATHISTMVANIDTYFIVLKYIRCLHRHAILPGLALAGRGRPPKLNKAKLLA